MKTRLSDHMMPDDIDNLIGPICEIADLETSDEDGSKKPDIEFDMLIMYARMIRDREGFLVTDGSELDA